MDKSNGRWIKKFLFEFLGKKNKANHEIASS